MKYILALPQEREKRAHKTWQRKLVKPATEIQGCEVTIREKGQDEEDSLNVRRSNFGGLANRSLIPLHEAMIRAKKMSLS